LDDVKYLVSHHFLPFTRFNQWRAMGRRNAGSADLRHDRKTNRREAPRRPLGLKRGTPIVLGRLSYTGGAVLMMALALCGCSNLDTSSWFSKPLDLFGTRSGYSYSNLNGAPRQERPVTANDLVDASGACPAPAPQSAPANPGGGVAPASDAASLLGGGVAIGMTECESVERLGRPNAVNLGQNPNGLRSAVLTYESGPRPGVYRFEAGRLTEMDRVEVPPPKPEPKKKVAKKKTEKKKPVESQNPQPTNGKS
jgi:hypothetical protein